VFVFTHDSFWVGEDGPTHQPIEHVASLRLIPNLNVWRPADAVEVAAAWAEACTSAHTPSVLLFTRQKLPLLPRAEGVDHAAQVAKGGYVLVEASGGAPSVVLIATGSEVGAAVEARAALEAAGTPTRVVSMPCVERFDAQPADYRAQVLPKSARKVSIEAGVTQAWWRFVGEDGLTLGIDHFGASAPGEVLVKQFGLDAAGVTAKIQAWL
jgi:transketolase